MVKVYAVTADAAKELYLLLVSEGFRRDVHYRNAPASQKESDTENTLSAITGYMGMVDSEGRGKRVLLFNLWNSGAHGGDKVLELDASPWGITNPEGGRMDSKEFIESVLHPNDH
jgi:hypothetical protein